MPIKSGMTKTERRAPPLPHHLCRYILCRIDADHGRRGRQRAHLCDEGARGGFGEVGADRLDALPFLAEDQPVRIFDIDMAMMRQTPRFGARPRAMLSAERDHAPKDRKSTRLNSSH